MTLHPVDHESVFPASPSIDASYIGKPTDVMTMGETHNREVTAAARGGWSLNRYCPTSAVADSEELVGIFEPGDLQHIRQGGDTNTRPASS